MVTTENPLLNEERRRAIVEMLARDGRLLVNDLAQHFGVSLVTVRNDLMKLQKRGLLVRVHGGAISATPGRSWGPPDPAPHAASAAPEPIHQTLARAAAEMILPHETVVLDNGRISYALAALLRGRLPLTVVTNSLRVAAELAGGGAEVLLTGGTLQAQGDLSGPLAEEALGQLNADRAFLEVASLDVAHGLTSRHPGEARLKRLMVRMAREVVVLSESDHVGRFSLYPIAPLGAVHQLVTDDGLAPSHRESLQMAGVHLTFA